MTWRWARMRRVLDSDGVASAQPVVEPVLNSVGNGVAVVGAGVAFVVLADELLQLEPSFGLGATAGAAVRCASRAGV